MNVEIGDEVALFPEKEYINGMAVAVHYAWHHYFNYLEKDLDWGKCPLHILKSKGKHPVAENLLVSNWKLIKYKIISWKNGLQLIQLCRSWMELG